MIRVQIPYHLRVLAQVEGEITLSISGSITQTSILDALEDRFPVLRGAIRDPVTKQRRSLLRFYACERDVSHERVDQLLSPEIVNGAEPFLIVGALAGG